MISSLHHERLAFSDDRLCTLAGNVVYLAGCILLTMGYHVPRNEALDELDAAGR